MKILVTQEADGAAIWRALNRCKPEISVVAATLAQMGAHLANPGAFSALVVSRPAWLAKDSAYRARAWRNLELLCLYGAEQAEAPVLPPEAGLPLLDFSAQASPTDIAAGLVELAHGAALGALASMRNGSARCPQEWSGWRLTQPAQPLTPDTPPLQPEQPRPGRLSRQASPGIVIHNLTVMGDLIQGGDKLIVSSAGDQQLRLNVQGQAHITQTSQQDQVNIHHHHSNTAGSFEQSAGGNQVNLNRVHLTGTNPTPPQGSPICRQCGGELQAGWRFCQACGTALEAGNSSAQPG